MPDLHDQYPASRGPSIFLDKSFRLPDLSRKIERPLLVGYTIKASNKKAVPPSFAIAGLRLQKAYTCTLVFHRH